MISPTLYCHFPESYEIMFNIYKCIVSLVQVPWGRGAPTTFSSQLWTEVKLWFWKWNRLLWVLTAAVWYRRVPVGLQSCFLLPCSPGVCRARRLCCWQLMELLFACCVAPCIWSHGGKAGDGCGICAVSCEAEVYWKPSVMCCRSVCSSLTC